MVGLSASSFLTMLKTDCRSFLVNVSFCSNFIILVSRRVMLQHVIPLWFLTFIVPDCNILPNRTQSQVRYYPVRRTSVWAPHGSFSLSVLLVQILKLCGSHQSNLINPINLICTLVQSILYQLSYNAIQLLLRTEIGLR